MSSSLACVRCPLCTVLTPFLIQHFREECPVFQLLVDTVADALEDATIESDDDTLPAAALDVVHSDEEDATFVSRG